jgi:UDP-N-acetylmuramoylalanine--D-glutamate ligase
LSERHLVLGLGVSGESIARALVTRGSSVVVVEESPGERSRERAARLADVGVEVLESPSPDAFESLVRDAAVVVPSPGVPAHHPVFTAAADAGTPVLGEVELASRWTRLPIVAVTGTNGKTTVTTLVRDILDQSGVTALAAGNIGLPLAEAVDAEAEVLVVEVSSFQLALTSTFRPRVAVWLNVADDHLDAHGSFAAYVDAKARIWANQGAGDLAVVNADDAVVLEAAASAPAAVTTFGLGVDEGHADWHVADGFLRRPDGSEILPVDDLPRSLPHDVANALAAVAAADAVGGTADGARLALTGFQSLPHRVALVVDAGGVRWYDDSKATNPHAALAAIRGFDSVVLVAGGRNKGLDLRALADARDRVRAVVAIGDAAPEVVDAFDAAGTPVQTADSMDAAVHLASRFARPGDVVLLSPGCASFDWYANYAERGDDFARAVRSLVGAP